LINRRHSRNVNWALDCSSKGIYFWSRATIILSWGEDVSENIGYIAYYVASQQKGSLRHRFASEKGVELKALSHNQYQLIQDFIQDKPGSTVYEAYIETPDNRRTMRWPQLEKAIEACKQKKSNLLITELGTLTSNESFVSLLLKAEIKFVCLDQPFVNQTNLEALSKSAQVQRKLHGKLIKEGLKMTSAKSGNPNAAEVISKVNKPKIDTAIVFACLLQPIIQDYRQKGYSQRQMVKTLNDEGFTAPEGGKWVLSQLQKVLDRVRLNEIAFETQSLIEGFKTEPNALPKIAEALNTRGVVSLKRGPWDDSQVKKLNERIQQIQDIVQINRFVLSLLPVLHAFRAKNLAPLSQVELLEQAGLFIRQEGAKEASMAGLNLDKGLQANIETLKQNLSHWPKGTNTLDAALEATIKHIPAYLKIVKGHIDQLAKVLELETHANRNLETVGLALPVTQLIQLFRELDEEDLQLLETLSFEAKNWQGTRYESVVPEKVGSVQETL